jgi:hypothetical protein
MENTKVFFAYTVRRHTCDHKEFLRELCAFAPHTVLKAVSLQEST